MSNFSVVVLSVVALVVVAAVSPSGRRFLKGLGQWGGAQADRAAEAMVKADPLGVYKSQIANAIDNGKRANDVVSAAGRQLESLNRQIADGLKEQKRLSTRISGVLSKGDPNNTATIYAGDLARVEANLKTNQDQLAIAQAQYDENLKLVEKFQREISNSRREAEDMGFQLAQSQAEKNLYEMTAALKNNLDLGDLSQARQRVQEQIDANRGSTRAARDLFTSFSCRRRR